MKKAAFALCWGLLFCLLAALPASAENGPSRLILDDLQGNFHTEPGGLTGTDLFTEFKELVPGDEKSQSIRIENRCSERKNLRLFLKGLPHSESENPLSPEVAAGESLESMTDFLSRLTLRLYLRGTLIFSETAETIIGQPVPLGIIPWNGAAELRAELSVPLSLGNEYAGRMGEIDWVFLWEDNAEGGEPESLTVRKLWSDGNGNHSGESVTVWLEKNGRPWDSAVLAEENQWCHVFEALSPGAEWTAAEITASEGYLPQYDRQKDLVTITNVRQGPVDPDSPDTGRTELRVEKQWADPDSPHPDFVDCILYRDEAAMETVRLSAENGWTHHWTALDPAHNWQVVEDRTDSLYIPEYRVQPDGTVRITNAKGLIQTGQDRWPVPVLLGAGLLLILLGWRAARHGTKDRH